MYKLILAIIIFSLSIINVQASELRLPEYISSLKQDDSTVLDAAQTENIKSVPLNYAYNKPKNPYIKSAVVTTLGTVTIIGITVSTIIAIPILFVGAIIVSAYQGIVYMVTPSPNVNKHIELCDAAKKLSLKANNQNWYINDAYIKNSISYLEVKNKDNKKTIVKLNKALPSLEYKNQPLFISVPPTFHADSICPVLKQLPLDEAKEDE